MLPPPPATDPSSLYRYRDGLYAADLLTAAIVELDLFTWLEAQPSSLTVLCESLGIHPRPTDVMLTLFLAMGLIERRGETYGVTALAREHLTHASPFSLTPYYASFKDRPICRDFVAILRSGRPRNWAGAAHGEWVEAMKKPEFARQFTAAMDCRGVYLGRGVARNAPFATRHRLLDIAGRLRRLCLLHRRGTSAAAGDGTRASAGRRGGTTRDRRPRLQRPRVGPGCGHACRPAAGRLRRPPLFERPARLGRADRQAAACRFRRRAAAGGLLVVHDAHLNDEKTGPLPVAAFSCLLMHSTEGRCYGPGGDARPAARGRIQGRRVPRDAGRPQRGRCDQSMTTSSRVRSRVLGFAFALAVITYLDRICISAAAPFIMDELHITVVQMSLVFGAFTLAYSIFEVPSGWLGDVYGPRRVLTRIALWWSAFTMLTGAARGLAVAHCHPLLVRGRRGGRVSQHRAQFLPVVSASRARPGERHDVPRARASAACWRFP